jgi:hypothetical protein
MNFEKLVSTLNQDKFVVLAAAALVLWVFAGSGALNEISAAIQDTKYNAPVVVGRIEAGDIHESSGLSASECQDVLWTHNDAGNAPIVFAMATNGRHLGAWKVTNARNIDWESISTYRDAKGKCFLFIGDFGDNDENRKDRTIYRIPEPNVTSETTMATAGSPLSTEPADAINFSYPDGPKNAEAILVHPKTGNIYVLTKNRRGPSEVHKVKPNFGIVGAVFTEKVGEIAVPSQPMGLLTGGSISPDGRRVMVCDVKSGYELVLPAGVADPDAIWKQRPVPIDLGERRQGEGISYGPDGISLYASSEKKNTPIIKITRKS